MAPLPLLSTALGATGSMFALEGSLLNAYLLYLANRFKGQRTDEHARAVFRCSLWYLPALLAGFVFHSRNWGEARAAVAQPVGVEELEDEENVVMRLRKQLAKVCMHEVMVAKQKGEGDEGKGKGKGHLCPPVVAGHAKGEVAGVLEEAVVAATAKAGGARIHVLQAGAGGSGDVQRRRTGTAAGGSEPSSSQ